MLLIFYNQELLDTYKISIDGEVRKPGTYNYANGMTLYDLLLEAEYFTDKAASNVTVFRNKKDAVFNPNDKEKIVKDGYPKFTLQLTQGFKSVFDSDFNFSKLDFITWNRYFHVLQIFKKEIFKKFKIC